MSVAIQANGPEPTAGIGQYYCWLRDDVLDRVPPQARRVLSVGCAAGLTEAELVKRGIEVVGIEKDATAAAMARHRGVRVLEGDVASTRDALAGQFFDCLLYADVLEHLPEPVAVLQQHTALLRPGGRAIISIPNFRHYSVLWALFVRGRFHEADAGIFDRTHLRITTRRLAEEWLTQVGLVPCATQYGMNRRRDRALARLSLGLLSEWVAPQVLIVASKPSSPFGPR